MPFSLPTTCAAIVFLLVFLVSGVQSQTNFTGDVISGYPVVTQLDIEDTPANAITRYWFRAAEAQGGIPYFLPVIVARGSNDSLQNGRKLSLSASVHGDELNGIPVVWRVLSQLSDTVTGGGFNGTIIALPTVNPNGNQHNQRNFYSSSNGGFLTNLNRVFPGESVLDGGDLPSAYAYAIWNNLWGNTSNVDIAVDLHTPSTSAEGPLWAYADFRLSYVQRLVELAQPDIIKIDPGEPGSIETTWVDNSIPAITLEIGAPKQWSEVFIQRSEDYIFKLLNDLEMLPNSSPPEVDLDNTYKGTNFSSVRATSTGWVQTYVNVLDDVSEGDTMATLYNSWGDVIENLTSSVAGRVLQRRTDPAVEQGGLVYQLVYNATEEA